MASNRTSHHVSQPIAPTWLEDPPVPTSSDPLKQNNASPTAPNNSITTTELTKAPSTSVTSVPLPIQSQPPPDSHNHASSLSLGFHNSSPSTRLTTQGGQSTQMSHAVSAPSPPQNQISSFGPQERSPVYQQAQGMADPKQTSPNNVFIPTSAQFQQETLPPNQFGHLHHQQNHDDRQSSASSRFANLLNVSNRTPAQQYPSLVSQPQAVHTDPFLPSAAPRGSQAQATLNDSSLTSAVTYRPFREEQSGHNPRYSQDVITTQKYQAAHAPSKLFEGIEQMEKQASQLLQSQTPTHIQQTHAHEEQVRGQLQNPTRQHHHVMQPWQGRLPQSESICQHSQALYSTFQHQSGTQFQMGSQSQFHGNDSARLRDSAIEAANKYRGVGGMGTKQMDGSPHLNGFRRLPSARSLRHSNGPRQMTMDDRSDGAFRMENRMDTSSGVRTLPNGRSRHSRGQTSGSHSMGLSCELMREASKAFQSPESGFDRDEYLNFGLDLFKLHGGLYDVCYDSVDSICVDQIVSSRIPYLVDTITAPVDDETPEDAQQKLIVKRKFVEAMEKLQGDQLPTKRRGNLPKESTAYLKRWFDQHYDHPYPSDEEKLEMSKVTKIGMQQISHWFINYRKRVWKPSLPPTHPVHMGENSKRPRKRMRKEFTR